MRVPTTLEQMRAPLAVRAINKCGSFLDGAIIRHANAAAFIDAACQQCQLADFGPGPFREGLSRLLDSCHREANLNLIGKLARMRRDSCAIGFCSSVTAGRTRKSRVRESSNHFSSSVCRAPEPLFYTCYLAAIRHTLRR